MQIRSLGQEDPLEAGLATHSSVSCLKNPMDREAWGSTVHRLQSQPHWSSLACMHSFHILQVFPSVQDSVHGTAFQCYSPCKWEVFYPKRLAGCVSCLNCWYILKKRMVFLMTFVKKRAKPYSENKYWFQGGLFIYFFLFQKSKIKFKTLMENHHGHKFISFLHNRFK